MNLARLNPFKMKLSIGQKFQLYVSGVIIIGAVIIFMIVRTVIRSEYTNNYSNELITAGLVLDNHLEGRQALLRSGIDILRSDPRFLAAIAEGDPATAQREVASFRKVVNADVFLVLDTAGAVLAYDSGVKSPEKENRQIEGIFSESSLALRFIYLDGVLYQVLASPISYGPNYPLGKVVVGYQVDDKLLQRLKRLTESELILVSQGKLIAATDDGLAAEYRNGQLKSVLNSRPPGAIATAKLKGEDFLVLDHVLSAATDSEILLARSLDAKLNPAIAQISLYIALAAAVGFIFLLYIIYRFTSNNLTAAVNRLVRAARKISEGKLSDPITPRKNDELGYLAERMEEMRTTLIANRDAIAEAHQQRLNSERLATIGQLSAGIIHDFKSPMTAIMMAVDGIEYNLGGEERRNSYCQIVKSQVKRMVNMTQDLLDYAHGNKSLNLEEIDLCQLLKTIVEEQQGRFNKKRIELSLSLPGRISLAVDPDKFQRVIDNLIGNAYEALSPGDRVEVTVRSTPDSLEISVADNGPGIPADIIDDIFKPFVTKGKKAGTGLGLAISRKVVEDHGGSLTVTSREGEGAAFTIQLSRNLVRTSADPENAPEENA